MTRGDWFRLVVALALPASLHAQTIHYEGGVSVASGKYIFTERTTSWTISNGLALGAGPVTFRVTVPLFIQNTTLLTGTTTVPYPTGGSNSGPVRDSSASRGGQGSGSGRGANRQVTSASLSMMSSASEPVEVPASSVTGFEPAFGDPTVQASVSTGGRSIVTFGVGVKAPLTDTTSFGTGEWDYGANLGVSRFAGRHTMLSADLAYWHLGDLPGLDLSDPIMASLSVGYLAPSGWGGSVAFNAASAVVEGFEDSYREIGRAHV